MRGRRKQKREKKEGEKRGAGETARAVESVTCVTLGAGAICPANRINPSYSHSCLCYNGQFRKGGRRALAGI